MTIGRIKKRKQKNGNPTLPAGAVETGKQKNREEEKLSQSSTSQKQAQAGTFSFLLFFSLVCVWSDSQRDLTCSPAWPHPPKLQDYRSIVTDLALILSLSTILMIKKPLQVGKIQQEQQGCSRVPVFHLFTYLARACVCNSEPAMWSSQGTTMFSPSTVWMLG